MKKKINLGIIGAGRMATFHLEVLSKFDDVSLRAIASTKTGEQRRRALCKKFNILNSYSDYNEMLSSEKLDCVYVVASVENVYTISMDVLKKGLNVFIEKPPGLFLNETINLAKIANSKSLINSVGLQRRYFSHIEYAKEYINSNGKLISIVVEAPERFEQIKSKNKFSKKVLDRWLIANGIHCLDLFLFFGGKPIDTKIISKKINERVNSDTIHALVDFDTEVVGHYISNWMSPGGWSIKLYCTGFRIDIKPIEKGKIIFPNGSEIELPIDDIDKKFKPGVYKLNRLFIDSINNKSNQLKELPTIKDSIQLMSLCEKLL